MIQNLYFLILFFISFSVGTTFQNCSNQGFLKGIKSGSNLSPSHPDIEPVADTKGVGRPLLDHKALRSFFSGIFTSELNLNSVIESFESIYSTEALSQIHMLGRPCDLIESGTMSACGYNTANLNLLMSQSSSTIREAVRIQLCHKLISNDDFLNTALSKINSIDLPPNSTSLNEAITQFYPAWDEHSSVVTSLSNLTSQMSLRGESPRSQWSLVLNVLCESPYWELL